MNSCHLTSSSFKLPKSGEATLDRLKVSAYQIIFLADKFATDIRSYLFSNKHRYNRYIILINPTSFSQLQYQILIHY